MTTTLAKPLQWYDFNRFHPLAAGLVGYYPMWAGMGGTAFDVAGGLDADNGGEWVPHEDGTTLQFALGTKAEITGSETGSLDFVTGDAFSFTAFAYSVAGMPTIPTLLAKRGASFQYQWRIDDNGTTPELLASNGAVTGTASSVPLNEWVHHAVTVDASGDVIFYVNGAAQGGGAGRTFTHAATNATIGNTNQDNVGWIGFMSFASAYNRALSPAEIRDLAADPFILSRMPSNLPMLAAATLSGEEEIVLPPESSRGLRRPFQTGAGHGLRSQPSFSTT